MALCVILYVGMGFSIVWILKQNISSVDDHSDSDNHDVIHYQKLNIIVFFATLLSTSRSTITFVTDRIFRKKISPSTLGLINILLKTLCIVLFDFRIIHVGRSNHDTRLMILYADIASNFFDEACQTYPSQTTCACCCCSNKCKVVL